MRSLEWRQYNDYIMVCENGEVKSHNRFVKGGIINSGYKRINTSHRGVNHKYLIHRLVAETFIPNPNNLPCVNHKDGDKLNNNVNNLEWCTYGENLSHAYKTGLRDCKGIKNPVSKLTAEQVLEIRKLYIKGKHCENNSYGLAKKYGVSEKCILNIIHNKSYTEALFENGT